MTIKEDGGKGDQSKAGPKNKDQTKAGSKSKDQMKSEVVFGMEALASTLQAFKAVCDTITTVSDNRRERARIVADSAESVREYELRRDALRAAMQQTFSERNRSLDEFFRHLDDAKAAGDVETFHLMAANITDVVKSGPLKGLSDLRESMMRGGHSFSIG